MLKAFKFRLYPTKSQTTLLDKTLESLRWVYNKTLEERTNSWEQEHRSISLMQSSKLLTGWKKQKPELNNVYSQVLQDAQARVDLAFRAFFRRVNAGEKTGYPRFKGYLRYDSLTYKQFGFKLGVNKLYLSKIGPVKVKMHRPIEGKIRTVTIRRNSRGKFFVSIVADVEAKMALFKGDSVVGVDVGLESFATLSTGENIVNPRFYRKEEAELVRAQRKLSSERKGSVQWCKRLRVVERVHERIGNKRTDFVHQISRRLVNRFGVVVFEALNIKGMMHNGYFAKSVGDAGWSMFVNAARYKAAEAGSLVVLVNPNGTSQTCSGCGLIVKKSLSDRVHRCGCGLVVDRDLNAAVNILRLGLQSLSLRGIEAQNL